ncbi:MAG TPA: aminopeptidase P N-terminal domain-containing protein [Chthonomonadaceae bacterium]|nr:aminopeptidase P N-terminal domain-containing protein [Chthonomonadaceae bacterium]
MTLPPADSAVPETRLHAADPTPPLDGFPPEEFQARREALRSACPEGMILIRGAAPEEAVMAPYRQNSAFFYLTGVDTPGAFLVLLLEGVPASALQRDLPPTVREILFLPARSPLGETWTGPTIGPGEETERAAGIEKTLEAGSLWSALIGGLRRNPLLYTLTPYGEQAKLSRDYALMQRIADIAPIAQFRDVAPALARQRMVKSAAERERLCQAIAITGEGQRAARAAITAGAGRWEYEVEARIYEAFRSRGATMAFPPIVGAGINATILHYEDNAARMQSGDLVVVDIGARSGHYAGDVTRTYPVGGAFSPRQQEIYALVLEAHEWAVAHYRPGTDSLKSLSDRCKAFLKESGLRARNLQGHEQTMDLFMPHGLTHHLGLDVHDMHGIIDMDQPLVPGSVITIEPGLYIPSEKIGVRLEDDYLVTETGLERLGPPLEKDIAALEAAGGSSSA